MVLVLGVVCAIYVIFVICGVYAIIRSFYNVAYSYFTHGLGAGNPPKMMRSLTFFELKDW